MTYLEQGTKSFRKANLALFIGGFVTFTILYCVQPLMPVFSKAFGISPAGSSLTLSVSTLTLAISMLVMATLSERSGRKLMMTLSLLSSSFLVLLSAFIPNFIGLLLIRALQGIALAGLPSIAMAYLGEEIAPGSLGAAMGLYIAGNSLGGMSGRILTGILTDFYSWRVALFVFGVLGLIGGVLFWIWLPNSANFRPHKVGLDRLFNGFLHHLKDPGMLCLYGISFLLMGSFMALYNYITFQLLEAPYHLSQTAVGWIFAVYIGGSFSSAWAGKLADRFGRRRVLWIAVSAMLAGAVITLDAHLLSKIIGVAVFTMGFFGSHSIASGWVGRRAIQKKAEASSLYLLCYYAGSSVGGSVAGIFWSHYGWFGVISMIAFALLLTMALSMKLLRIPAVAVNQV